MNKLKLKHQNQIKKWKKSNRERIKITSKIWREANKERQKQLIKRWEENNSERNKINHSKWKKLHPEKVKKSNLKWRKANPEKSKESYLNWRKNNSKKFNETSSNSRWRFKNIRNKNGDSFQIIDYNKLYEKQNGKCAICKKHSTEFNRKLAADHNHLTGVVRGLLCLKCNIFLSYLENDKKIYFKAKNYL